MKTLALMLGFFFSLLTGRQISDKPQPLAVILPHHDLASKYKDEVLQKAAINRSPTKTVILLSPNHFYQDQSQIIYSDDQWDLHNGILEGDKDISELMFEQYVKNHQILRNDHGVYNVLGAIKENFPDAKVVTALIGDKAGKEKLDLLADKMGAYCGQDCLVVASVDFSHYLPAAVADVHDAFSMKVLEKADPEKVYEMETDADGLLYSLFKWLGAKQSVRWHQYSHTNSGTMLGSRDSETTSHITGWYWEGSSENIHDSFSYVLATNVDPQEKIKGLGERFFYGADRTDTQLDDEFCSDWGCVYPSDSKLTTVEVKDQKYSIYLSSDVAVAGLERGSEVKLSFLPLTKIGEVFQFTRGEEKTIRLQDLLGKIPTNNKTKVDIQNGCILIAK